MIKLKAKNRTSKIVLKDFSKVADGKSVSTELECAEVYNFNTNNGVLEKGLGLRVFTEYMEYDKNSEQYPIDVGALNKEYFNKLGYFKQYFSHSGNTQHRLLIHASNGKLYMYQRYDWSNVFTSTYEWVFDTTPVMLAYKKKGVDTLLISSNDRLITWETGRTPYEVTGVPVITSMCVYNDVLYCTIAGDSSNIWYNTSINPETIGTVADDTDIIVMDVEGGGGSKIVVFKENVYIFRDFGISRLNTYIRKKPTTNLVYLSDSKIYANTICECGDYIIFATRDGLYRFSGATVTKIEKMPKQMTSDIDNYAVATVLQDNYYLSLKYDFNDGKQMGCENADYKNNVLFKLNLNDYSFEMMRGIDIKDMLTVKTDVDEKIVVIFNSLHKEKVGEITNDGECFGEVMPKIYCSNYVVQEDLEPITIRSFSLEASKGIQFKIITEQGEFAFNTYCDGVNQFQTIIQCDKFKVKIESNQKDAFVNWVQLEYVRDKK